MLEIFDKIEAQSRTGAGKSVTHKLRAQGYLPAVVYGSLGDPRAVMLLEEKFGHQRHKFGSNHLYDLELDQREKFKVIIKEVQRHPVTRQILHVDLYTVDMDKVLRMQIPIELVGTPVGVSIGGGLLMHTLRTVEVQGLPAKLPQIIKLDVSELAVGHSLHLQDLKLPEGVSVTSVHNEAVAAVIEPDRSVEEAKPAAAAATPAEAAGAAAKGGAAKPGAPAAAAAAKPGAPAKPGAAKAEDKKGK